MSADTSGISTIGAAAVGTIGTLAVTGAALKVVGNTAKNVGGGGGRVMKKKSNYNVFKGHKGKSSKKSSLLGF